MTKVLNCKHINLLNPLVFFCLIWFVQVLGYLFYRNSFGPYENETYLVVFLGFIAFISGALSSQFIFRKKNIGNKSFLRLRMNEIRKIDLTKPVLYVGIIYFLVGIIVTWKIAEYIQLASKDPLTSFAMVREVINYDFNNHRYFYDLFRYFHIGITTIVCLFCFLNQINRKTLVFLFFLGLASAFLTTSRLFLLFYLLSLIAILYSYNKINSKHVFLFILSFFGLFFILAVLIKKGYGDLNNPIDILKWNLQVYLFSPLAAFNNYIKTNIPSFDSIVSIPNSVKHVLNSVGISLKDRTNLMPFVEIPLKTNVYTFFYPQYHDGGKTFVFLACFVFGFIHQFIYLLNQAINSPLTIYIFSISLYPLALTFFEDAYFSSPGIFVFQILPIVVIYIIFLLKIKFSPKATSHE